MRLTHRRVLPGPLKSLPRHRPVSTRATGLALTGLSLVAALALAPQLRVAAPEPAPVAEVVSEPARETAPPPRIVGAAPAAVEAAPTPEAAAPVETPTAVQAAPVAPARSAAAPALDLGKLPVLALDADAFEAPVPAEPAPRATGSAPPRPAAHRLAAQP